MIDVYKAVSELASNNNIDGDNDYIKDGLRYCGVCNTPKQCRVPHPFTGNIEIKTCVCNCYKIQEEKERAYKRKEAIERMRRECFRGSRLIYKTFDNMEDCKIKTVAKNYADNFEKAQEDGKGLLLFGEKGTGKTHAASAIANYIIDQGKSCTLSTFGEISNDLMGMYGGKNEYINDILRNRLIVIDDLSSERDTPYMNEIVFTVIDSIVRAKRPLIVTTNLISAELMQPEDIEKGRIYSRLLEMCIPVEAEGEDRRKKILMDTFAEYKDILGL